MLEFEKDLLFETELYKKGNVYKLVNMPYFKLNCSDWLIMQDIKRLIDYANKDRLKGLKLVDYDDILTILINQESFYKIVRDIFLNSRGYKLK